MTQKVMSKNETAQFRDEYGELLSKSGFNMLPNKDLSIEIPDYSKIDGVDCAAVKLSSKRRKT